MLAERDRFARRLCSAVQDDPQPAGGGLDEDVGRAFPLLEREQEAFASRPQGEDPVQPVSGEEVDVGTKGVLVQALAVVAQGSYRRRQRSSDHRPNLRAPSWNEL
jgi:hypothetical protein